jgi:hypothetical protein
MKCYRLSTVRSIVNYVDNSRPVEKFGVAYYSWLEATVREHRFSRLESLDLGPVFEKRAASAIELPLNESQLEIGSFSPCRDCVAVDTRRLLASGDVWSGYFLPGGNTFGPPQLLFGVSPDD